MIVINNTDSSQEKLALFHVIDKTNKLIQQIMQEENEEKTKLIAKGLYP